MPQNHNSMNESGDLSQAKMPIAFPPVKIVWCIICFHSIFSAEVCLVGVFPHSVSTRRDPCVRVCAPLSLASPFTRKQTRATLETSNYPRRPWDRYTAPNSKCIGAEHPPPQKKKINKNEKLLILVIGLVEKMVALWNSLVTWKLAQYLSKVWKPNCQVFHLWLFCGLLILFVCHVHSGSHQ